MLNLFPQRHQNCEQTSRRNFMLQVGGLGAMGLGLDQALRAQAVAGNQPAADVNCILIWTRGGTSHHDTLDPKPEASASVRGDFSVIDTALPGVQFTDQMPNFARQANTFATVRNLNPRNGAHGAADTIMMSGRRFNPAVHWPCYGSVVVREQGYRTTLPPFIQLGTNVDQRFGGGQPGHLGLSCGAFVVPGNPADDRFQVRDVTPPGGMSLDRLSRRQQALSAINSLQQTADNKADALQALDNYYQNAFSIITSPATQEAFSLDQEEAKLRDSYGRTELGQSCLLARRLIEAGTRFVTVTSGGWDTHTDNFGRLKKLLPPIDQAYPALVADLKDRGMLDNTLVIWLTDFGRTPTINSAAGRDHWSSAGMFCMAGAGTPAGLVLGQTDETGARPVGPECYPEDVAATIFRRLGIPLDTVHVAPDGRPIVLCDGEPIAELLG
ncbi:MAG: DUF1501 domain-containing protein [Planctomycetaceae bacterium]|nr:DUF1501 domain-containing protein [Planctomycetaceae bacterium]